jgi:tRNA(Ile)-lysidine synthase
MPPPIPPSLPDPWFARASRRRRYLVGVSGGADSVALLHLLLGHGFRRLVVCHLDHRLRGRASTDDARFVARIADALGLPVETARVDVRACAAEAKESIEVAARRARHEFFAACAARLRCPRVVLAHHADDQAETVLWNLLRGSHGPKGMSEIQTVAVGRRRIELHRPLLGHRRAELREFLRRHGIRWREDATNAEPHTPRNRLRHEALPLLAGIAGRDVVPPLVRAACGGADAAAILDWALEQARVADPQGRLHLPALRKLPAALQRAAMHRYLSGHGVPGLDRATILRCLELLDPSGPPALDLPGSRRLRRRAGRIWLE